MHTLRLVDYDIKGRNKIVLETFEFFFIKLKAFSYRSPNNTWRLSFRLRSVVGRAI